MNLVLALIILLVILGLRFAYRLLQSKWNTSSSRRRASTTAKARPFDYLPLSHASQKRQRKPDWVVNAVITLATHNPDAGCRRLSIDFNRYYANTHSMTVSKTFVADLLKKHRYAITQKRRLWKHRIPTAIAKNRIWGLDLTGKTDEEGQLHNILGLIDHGSRLALQIQPLHDKTAITILKTLIFTIELFGKPKMIRCDNEAVFKSKLFRFSLKLLGIRQQFSALGCPWQNGRIERLFGTLKQKLDQISVIDFGHLQHALLEFQVWYNHIRPHQHLQGWTPAEAWLGVDPYKNKIKFTHYVTGWGGLLTGYYLRR